MNYVLKTKLLENKSVQLALTSVYGIGRTKSLLICQKLGFLSNFKVKEMSDHHWQNLLKIVDHLIIDCNINLSLDLKNLNKQNEKKLINLNIYRGSRIKKGLPARGQRTHSNAQTAKKFSKNIIKQKKFKQKNLKK